jgi:SPP1 gp7 family putative phage head morphogenesis protein
MYLNRLISKLEPGVIANKLVSLLNKETVFYSRRDRRWLKFIALVSKFEKIYSKKIKYNFKKQERIVISNLSGIRVKRGTYDFFLFDRQECVDRLESLNEEMSRLIIKKNGERVLLELADLPQFKSRIKKDEDWKENEVRFDFNIDSPEITEFIKTYSYKLAITVTDEMMDGLRELFQEAFEIGSSTVEIGEKVQRFFELKRGYEADRIARTEMIRAAHQGALEAYAQSGVVVAKEWLTGKDEKVCPWCSQMDGKRIELREKFFGVGDILKVDDFELAFDYSEITAPPLHPNCRCDLIPIVDSIYGF